MNAVDALMKFEGMTSWMYLDTAKTPVVTTGAGLALFTLEDAIKLPWNTSLDRVRLDYTTVRAAQPGHIAGWYRPLTTSRIPEEFIRSSAQAKLEQFRQEFCQHFPEYPEYPDAIREALDDLMYNLGPHWPIKKRQDGRLMWKNLGAAVAAKDWPTAALHCHRQGISEERNGYVVQLFKSV